MSARSFIVAMAALALIGLLGFGLISQGSANLSVGDAAPDQELPKLDGSGTASLADYRGSWVLVNFWASWCAPCRDEAPALQRFTDGHRGDLTVVGINTQDLSGDAEDFAAEFGLDYTILRDPDSAEPLSDDYGATGLPESFLVDPDGNLAAICRGPIDSHDLDGVIAPLAEGRAPDAAAGGICRTTA